VTKETKQFLRKRGSKKPVPHVERQKASNNFFAPFRTEMDAEEKEDDQLSEEQQRPAVAGRPPPIVLTSTVNLIHLQKKLRLSERELPVPKQT
jgi:hypothetical protein